MQNNISKLIFILFISLINSSAICYADKLPPLTHKLSPSQSGLPAAELRLNNLDEQAIDIRNMKGKVLIINFWASWCPPCRREMGSLQRLYQATKAQGVEVLAVNIGEDDDTVFSFMGSIEPAPEFQLLLDPDAQSMSTWKIRGLPTTYIIAADGTVAYTAVGGREFDHPEIIKKVTLLSQQ